jgi:hypothetical protein
LRIHSGVLVLILLMLWVMPSEAGLLRYWRMNDGTGTSTVDASGNGGTVTLCNTTTCPSASGPAWGTGRVQGGLVFDGTSDNGTFTNINPTVISICVWVNMSAATNSQQVVTRLSDEAWDLRSRDGGVANSGPNFIVRNTSGTYYAAGWTTALSAATWYHLCGTYDADTVRLYVNGVERATNTTATGNLRSSASDDGVLGTHSSRTTNWFVGTMDEVRIYDHVLTPETIMMLFIRPRARAR